MVKVKIFGVIRSTTGFSNLDIDAKTVKDVFAEISKKMEAGYYDELKKLEAENTKKAPVEIHGSVAHIISLSIVILWRYPKRACHCR